MLLLEVNTKCIDYILYIKLTFLLIFTKQNLTYLCITFPCFSWLLWHPQSLLCLKHYCYTSFRQRNCGLSKELLKLEVTTNKWFERNFL